MLERLKRWPPIVWPAITFASLLILMGGGEELEPALLAAGIVLALAVCGLALYLAVRAYPDRARPPLLWWAMGGVGLFYVINAVIAATAGPEYAVAALAAGLVPLTAVALLVALARSKTIATDGLEDRSASADADPYPGIGMDDRTALGDTPEHSDALDDPGVSSTGGSRRRTRADR